MNSVKLLWAVMFSVLLSACGGGGGGSTPAATTYSISGTVSGATVAGVTVSLSGAGTSIATTDASGNYSFTGLANGSYTISPSMTGFTFSPTSSAATVSGANVTGKNFTATASTAATYNVSGTTGTLAGATLTLSGAGTGSVVSATGGAYSFTGLANGAYTVTPSLTGYTFSPASASVTVSNGSATVPNFVPTAIVLTYSISGTVTGATAAGVTMTLTGAANQTVTTAANGTYTFAGLANGNYTVTPSKVGFSFTPLGTAVTVSGNNVTATNFTATASVAPTYTLSGTTGTLNGVTLNLTGAAGSSTTSTGGGNYSFAGLAAGTYTVTPSITGYTFAPASANVTITAANATVPNFVPTAIVIPTYSISGTVSGSVTAGVTVNLTGTAIATTTTAANGTYSFTGLANGSYTVSPALAGNTFAPLSTTVTVNNANVAATNFTATANVAALATVSGTVTGAWVEGVTITMSSGVAATTTTNATGNYSFANVPAGATYVVTPSLSGYTYAPASQTVAIPAGAATATVPALVASSAIPSFTISGTVNYAGAKTGLVHVKVVDSLNPSFIAYKTTSQLTAGSGTYTVRGVNPGNWLVIAEMDSLGNGASNASNPATQIAMGAAASVTTANLTGVNVSIADPLLAPVAVTPVLNGVSPGSGAVFVQHSFPTDLSGKEIADQYKVYWGTDAATATVGGGTKIVAAPGTNNGSPIIITGLTNASVLYFKISALVGGVESAASPVSPPVTVGPVLGGNTVSGTVSTPGAVIPAGAQMLVGVFSNTGIYFTIIQNPTTAQAYSVTGVPAGTYNNFAVIDMNANGVIDSGDISNTNGNPPMITVAGPTTGNLSLVSNISSLKLMTSYDATWLNYGLQIQANDGIKRVVGVTVFSGPNVSVPSDTATQSGGNWGWVGLGVATPAVGNSYKFKVFYSDGTSQIMTNNVTGVLGASNVATGLATNPAAAGASPIVPQFSWLAPVAVPAGATYSVYLNGPGANWYSNTVSSATTSALYNFDGGATPPSLTLATLYNWGVTVSDSFGNTARSATIPYTPTAVGLAPVALTPLAAITSYLADVTSIQGVTELWSTGMVTGPTAVAYNRNWVAAGGGVYNQSAISVRELTANIWSAALTTATETYPAYYMNANTTGWVIESGAFSWTLNLNNTLSAVHPRVGNITMTIVGSDLSGTPILHPMTGLSIGTYPAGSIAYTQTGATSSLANYRIFVDPFDRVTDGVGTPLIAMPAAATIFCTQGTVFKPITPTLAGENYEMFNTPTADCSSAGIAGATLSSGFVTIAQMPVLNGAAPAVMGVTTGLAVNSIIAVVPNGVYSGNYQIATKPLGLIFDKNRTATNAELQAMGAPILP